MSRRLLRGGLLAAALFGTIPLAAAKPPDLPAEIKDVVTPFAVPDDGLPPASPTDAVATAPPTVEESVPAFYRLHLAERKTMTSCLLFGVHPLLALTPPDAVMYWPEEIGEALVGTSVGNCTAGQTLPSPVMGPVGGVVIGEKLGSDILVTVEEDGSSCPIFRSIGVNSDAGLTGSIVLNERNFDVQAQEVPPPAAPASECPCLRQPQPRDSPIVISAAGVLQSGTASDNLRPLGNANDLMYRDEWHDLMNLLRSLTSSNSGAKPRVSEQMHWSEANGPPTNPEDRSSSEKPATKPTYDRIKGGIQEETDDNKDETPPTAPVSQCPYLNQPRTTPTPPMPERTVLDNLKALEEAHDLFESAQEMMRTGRLCEALDFVEKIAHLCPGSHYDEMARALVAEVFKHFPAAAEEAEEGAKQKEEQERDGWQRFQKIFFPFFQSRNSDPVERVNEMLKKSEDLLRIEAEWAKFWGVVQEESEGDEDETPPAPEVPGTPIWRILVDLFNGQGLNLYLEKPPVPQGEGEEQEAPHYETKLQEIEHHLNMPVTMDYRNVDLRAVLDDLHHAFGLDIIVDEKAMANQGVGAAQLVTLKLDQVALKTALQVMLKKFGLTYVIEDDAIHVTTLPLARFEKSDRLPDGGLFMTAGVWMGFAPGVAPQAMINGCSPCDEPGAQVMADGLLKAARLALESGNHAKAADLARQAYALDPQRMHNDAAVFSLYLLVADPTASTRINNMPAPCPAGSPCPSGVCLTKPVALAQPTLPGVHAQVVAALEKVLAEAEAKPVRLEIVIEEEQEPRQCETESAGSKAWDSVRDLVGQADCLELLQEVVDFRLAIIVGESGGKSAKMVSWGLLGLSVEDVPAEDDDDN